MIRPFSWSVNQFPTRVVIIIIMDHPYNNNNKWRSDAIFSDPRVWINRGSTMDQHGSTWISRLQHVAFSLPAVAHVSCVRLMAHASWLTCHASCVMRHASCLTCPASDSWLMAHGSWLMAHVSWLTCHASWLMAHGSCVRLMAHVSDVPRPTSHVPRPFSTIQPPPVAGHDDNKAAAFSPCTALRFAPIALYGMG